MWKGGQSVRAPRAILAPAVRKSLPRRLRAIAPQPLNEPRQRFKGDVLLVGSVPLSSAEDVLATCCGVLGHRLACVPDGETGDRTVWVVFQAHRVFDLHPNLETVMRPKALQPDENRKHWMPTGMEDMWDFRVTVSDPRELVFDDLLYASTAAESYETFTQLKRQGEIPQHMRLQVSLPLPRSGVSWFFRAPGEIDRVLPAYREALVREVESLVQVVPPHELAIQWDVCWEVLDVEGFFPWRSEGNAWDQYTQDLAAVSSVVPPEVSMGLHLCYGDLNHRHMKEPASLATVVEMANRAVRCTQRPIDWVHMPVPQDRTDDEYFQPLRNLDIGNTKVFLGLVHFTDGVDGTLVRLQSAKKYLSEFGISTECGLGRRKPCTIEPLLQLHEQVAAHL